MKRRFMKRVLSLLLAVAMVLGSVQMPVFTQEVQAEELTNVARGKSVAARYTADNSDSKTSSDRPLTMAVDGTNNDTHNNYGEFGKDNERLSQYFQVNLGESYDIESVKLYRYWNGGRIYGDTVVAIAETEEAFAAGNAVVLFNSDDANVHGFGQGSDGNDYGETSSGKVLDAPDGTKGQYVRVYMYGVKGGGTTNHIVELEVYSYVEAPISPITMGTKPNDGTVTTGQPFKQNTAESGQFRIPALITGKNGVLIAAADARWNNKWDGGGLDTLVTRSNENGDTSEWHYTYANYLGDNGNVYNAQSSTFIDPALAYQDSTGKLYMLVDIYPYSVALNGSGSYGWPTADTGFTTIDNEDYLLLKRTGDATFDYYLDGTEIKKIADKSVVAGYSVDAYFNITKTLKDDSTSTSNLFFMNSPFQVARTGFLYLTTSDDNGATWSAPQLLNMKDGTEIVCLVGPGRGLVTSDNVIMFPCYSFGSAGASSQKSNFIYSADHGQTWERSPYVQINGSWSSENVLVELGDGTIRCFYRNPKSQICYIDATGDAESGYTWGTPVETGIANRSDCQLTAITYSKTIDGQKAIVLACPTNTGTRANGKIFVGLVNADKTMNWKYSYTVNGTTDFYGYSCITELNDGTIGLLYEDVSDYEMTYANYDIQTIAPGASVGTIWLENQNNAVVNSLDVTPGVAVNLKLSGTAAGTLNVSSNNVNVVAVLEGTTLKVTATEAAADKETAIITIADGTNTITLNVTVNTASENVVVGVGETKTYVDTTGNYENAELTGLDTAIAEVKLSVIGNPKLQAQIATGVAAFDGAYIDIDECLYTFTSTGTENQYTVAGKTSAGTTVYLRLDDPNNQPNKADSSPITVKNGATPGTFKLYCTTKGVHLHFYPATGKLSYDRCSNSCGVNDEFEIFVKSNNAPADSPIEGYAKLSDLTDFATDTQYLIAKKASDGKYYLLRPVAAGSANYLHVAKLTNVKKAKEPAVQLATAMNGEAANYNGELAAIKNNLYTFTYTETNGNNKRYNISAVNSDGNTVYFNVDSDHDTGGKRPHQDSATSMEIIDTGNGTFNFYAPNGNDGEGAYVHFRGTSDAGLYFDRCGGNDCGALHAFELYEVSETESSAIDGYKKLTSASEIEDGGEYLIVWKLSDTEMYLLNPPAGTETTYISEGQEWRHVAKYTGQEVESAISTQIEIKGVKAGETSVKIGNITYKIKVKEVIDVELLAGQTYTTQGKIYSKDESQTVGTVSASLVAPYKPVTELESGQRYLIGKDDVVLTNESQTPSNGWTKGIKMVSPNYNTGVYSDYSWLLTVKEKTTNASGATVYKATLQANNGAYVNFATPGNGNTAINLSDTEQVIDITVRDAESFNISYSAGNWTSYFNNFGDADWHCSGWKTQGDNGWKFYEGITSVTFTAASVGSTKMEIGDAIYNFIVKDEKDVTIHLGETYVVPGEITADPTVEGIVIVDEVGNTYTKYTGTAAEFTGGTYLIGKENFIMKNKEVRVANEPEGMDVQGISSNNPISGLYDEYLWTFTPVEENGTVVGYAIQDVNGEYIHIVADKTDANKGHVYLDADPQIFTIGANGAGGFNIRTGNHCLNAFGGDSDNIAGYNGTDAGSNFYLYEVATTTDILIGKALGKTSVKVGTTVYNVAVVDNVDYQLLDQQCRIAQILVNDNSYTQDSLDALAAVLTTASEANKDENRDKKDYSSVEALQAAQELVDQLAEELTTAIRELQKKSVSVAILVGEECSVPVSGFLDEDSYTEDEWKIAEVYEMDGTLEIKGLEAGIVQVTANGILYNILVAEAKDNFPIIGKTGEATGAAVTKLTISADNSFNLGTEGAGTVAWRSGNETTTTNAGTVAPVITLTDNLDGTVTIVCADTVTTVYSTVTAEIDGKAHTIPVIVHPKVAENAQDDNKVSDISNEKLVNIYIDEISNLDVYYSWNCGTDLIQAVEGEAFYVSFTYAEPVALDFMGSPDDGHALTYMASTNSAGDYMVIHEGDDLLLDMSENGFLNYPEGAGEAQGDLFAEGGQDGEAIVMAMLAEGTKYGADGTLGFTRKKETSVNISSDLTFRAAKLPTVEKTVAGILPANIKRAEYRPYTPGMTARENEYVYFKITVTNYRPLTINEFNNKSVVKYSNVTLTDTALSYQDENGVWRGASFIIDKGKDTVLTEDQIIPAEADISKVITTDIQNDVWPEDESVQEIEHVYYVAYKIKAEDLGKSLQNTVDLDFGYKSKYSTGAFEESANAKAEIVVSNFASKNLVVDFGLPVTTTLETWATTDANNDATTVRLKSGSATYGKVDINPVETAGSLSGWEVTYTPTETLKGTDTITLTASNTDETFKMNVYPASSVYYEEKFMTLEPTPEPTPTEPEVVQQDAQPGAADAANYGYDAAYENRSNTEICTKKTTDGTEKATFEFVGTGVDIYANCDADTGIAMVMVRDAAGSLKKVYAVDTVLRTGAIDGDKLSGETLNVPIVSIPANSLQHGKYEVSIIHTVKKATSVVAYTKDTPFELPVSVGTAKIMEAEYMELQNSGTGEKWPMEVTEVAGNDPWASNGKFVNAMNSGDSAVLYYDAPEAGTYTATVTYKSGDTRNGFSWTVTPDAKTSDEDVTSGSVTMGAGDSAGYPHTGTFTFEVKVAGKGRITFHAGQYNAPQLDKMAINLGSKAAKFEKADLLPTATKLRLDGFRVYGTLPEAEATPIYSLDNEANPAYLELRDSVMAIWGVTSTNSAGYAEQLAKDTLSQIYAAAGGKLNASNQVMILDGNDAEVKYAGDNAAADFLDKTSKNELYLYKNQSLVFTLDAGVVNPQIALKALNGDTNYSITAAGETAEGTMSTNVEMYYPLKMSDGATTFRITNTGDGVLAVTKLKVITYLQATSVILNEITPTALADVLYNPDENVPTNESVTDVFADVKAGAWYVDAVQYVYDSDFMTGNGNTFNPTGNVTRAQVVSTLYRMAGRPEVTDYKACEELQDVKAGAWYTDAVCWAYNTGITTGNATTKMFNVNEPVIRQQLASFMYRYAECFGMDVTASADLSGMLNADQVAGYAQTAVKWAVAEGIISGSEVTTADGSVAYDLKPQATATRAQMAQILMNFDSASNK